MIKVLGINGSTRRTGNSSFLLEHAMKGAADAASDVQFETYSITGKKYAPCVNCGKCADLKGECVFKDDFQELRDKWADSDVIIYSLPVYVMSIPGQIRCFMDRLSNSRYCFYNMQVPRSMKVIGGIAQGLHIFSGQEHTLTDIMNHAMVMGCLYANGDSWESYIGAGGWTYNEIDRDSIKKHYADGEGDIDAVTAVKASYSVGRRCAELALLLQAGAEKRMDIIDTQKIYKPFVDRVKYMTNSQK
jgi:multimeric flavodoxin WrbA